MAVYYKERPIVLRNKLFRSLLSSGIFELSDNVGKLIWKRVVPASNDEIIAYSPQRNPMNHPEVMFRKSKVENIGGYNEKFHLFEDYYLWIRMLQKGRVAANLDECLYMRTPAGMFKRRDSFCYAKDMLKFRW